MRRLSRELLPVWSSMRFTDLLAFKKQPSTADPLTEWSCTLLRIGARAICQKVTLGKYLAMPGRNEVVREDNFR